MVNTRYQHTYRIHLQALGRTTSFIHRPSGTDVPLPFRIDYRCRQPYVSLRVLPFATDSDFYFHRSFEMTLCAFHYDRTQPGQRFHTVVLRGNDKLGAGNGGHHHFRVPLDHVKAIFVKVTVRTTVRCTVDAAHPIAPKQVRSRCVDWHPAQVLAVERRAVALEGDGFAVPIFGGGLARMRCVVDETRRTVRYELVPPRDVKFVARKMVVRVEALLEEVAEAATAARTAGSVATGANKRKRRSSRPRRTPWLPLNQDLHLDHHINLASLHADPHTRLIIATSALEVITTPDIEMHQSYAGALPLHGDLYPAGAGAGDLMLLVGPQETHLIVCQALLVSQSQVAVALLMQGPPTDLLRVNGLNVLRLPDECPKVWELWRWFALTGAVPDDRPELMMPLLCMARRFDMHLLRHACAMQMLLGVDFDGDWRAAIAAMQGEYGECVALRKLVGSASSVNAWHRASRMLQFSDMYGADPALSMRAQLRKAYEFLQRWSAMILNSMRAYGDERQLTTMMSITGGGLLQYEFDGTLFMVHEFVLEALAPPHFVERLEDLVQGRMKPETLETLEGCGATEIGHILLHVYCGDVPEQGTVDPGVLWRVARHFDLERLAWEMEEQTMYELQQNPCRDLMAQRLMEMRGAHRTKRFCANVVHYEESMQLTHVGVQHSVEVANHFDYLSDDSDWEEGDFGVVTD